MNTMILLKTLLLLATNNATPVDTTAVQAKGFCEPKDVEFTARVDNTKQRYVIMMSKQFDKQKKHHLLLAFHGHGADRWQYITGDFDEANAPRDLTLKYDMIYVSPDYRAKTSWMGPKAEADVVQIIEDLKKQYKIDKVFLVGGSMGGASVLSFAVLHPELIAGVSSQNGTANQLEYLNFQDAIQESYGGTKQQLPEEYKKRSAEYWPERFTMPVAFTTGGKDKSVPPLSVRRLANILRVTGRQSLLIHRTQTGHTTNYDDTRAALDFVIRTALGLPLEDKTPEAK